MDWDFAIGRFHVGTETRRNKTHSIFAHSKLSAALPRRLLVPCASLAWGLPKYQSHTRLQIIYVYIVRAPSTTFTRRRDSPSARPDSSYASFFFARNVVRIFLIHPLPASPSSSLLSTHITLLTDCILYIASATFGILITCV